MWPFSSVLDLQTMKTSCFMVLGSGPRGGARNRPEWRFRAVSRGFVNPPVSARIHVYHDQGETIKTASWISPSDPLAGQRFIQRRKMKRGGKMIRNIL